MNHRTTAGLLAATTLALTLAACGGDESSSDKASAASSTGSTVATVKAQQDTDANAVYRTIHAAVTTTSLTAVVTETNDGNHLMGRPHQYTSALKFADSRIKAADVDGLEKDDVTRGGGIEVFVNHKDAQARADYIQKVTQGLPALSEYDFVHGSTVLRISHILTLTQAKEYDQAGGKL
ncbi:hypothetical protein ACFZAM_02940 [Streptomyces sp. NPDC008079]|uniref:hypothetical protein n=1 Tax=Streptomyces sp. NPDC008079 TaxID=3364806 RepID=UPI0036EDD9C1